VGKGLLRSNIYFVRSGLSWALIDAASAKCGPLIQKAAMSLFGEDSPPASILLTHDHPDHAGSARELAQMWNCPVWVHPDELPLVVGDVSTFHKYANPLDRWIVLPLLRLMEPRRTQSVLSQASLKDVARPLDPGAELPGLPDWEPVFTPGHTPGHVALFRRSDRVLITGDALVTVNLNSVWGLLLKRQRVSGPPWYTTWSRRAAKESGACPGTSTSSSKVIRPLCKSDSRVLRTTRARRPGYLRAKKFSFSKAARLFPVAEGPARSTSGARLSQSFLAPPWPW
jgi:glyoxylase-like metal-dependent hydrolase (beta-lactamase superfamily II)